MEMRETIQARNSSVSCPQTLLSISESLPVNHPDCQHESFLFLLSCPVLVKKNEVCLPTVHHQLQTWDFAI